MYSKRYNRSVLARIYRVAAIAAIVLAIVIGAGFAAALLRGFDAEIMHFDSTVWFWLFSAGMVISAVIGIMLAVLSRGYNVTLPSDRRLSYLDLVGRIFGALAALNVFGRFIKNRFIDHLYPSKFSSLSGFLALFIAVALILGLTKNHGKAKVSAVVHLVAAVAMTAMVFTAYFDFSSPVNGPVRNAETVALCSSLLVLLSETRLSLSGQDVPLGAPFAVFVNFFAASASLGIGAMCFLPVAADKSLYEVLSVNRLAVVLGVSIVALARMFSLADMLQIPPPPKEEPASEETDIGGTDDDI